MAQNKNTRHPASQGAYHNTGFDQVPFKSESGNNVWVSKPIADHLGIKANEVVDNELASRAVFQDYQLQAKQVEKKGS